MPPSSVWVGSRSGEPILLEEGSSSEGDTQENGVMFSVDQKQRDIVMLGDETTMRPFGKAINLRLAKYFAFPGWTMSCFCFLLEAATTCFHTLPILFSIFITADIVYGEGDQRDFDIEIPTIYICKIMFVIFSALHFCKVAIGSLVEIAAKWLLIGRRRTGRYNWYVSKIFVMRTILIRSQ
jgi:hypothetical protein